jgi:hypothetical protein
MGLKTSTASIKLRQRSTASKLAIIEGKSHLDTLPKQVILIKRRGFSAGAQAVVNRLVAYATKQAFSVPCTVIGVLATAPTRLAAQRIPRLLLPTCLRVKIRNKS